MELKLRDGVLYLDIENEYGTRHGTITSKFEEHWLCAGCDDYRLFPDTTWKSSKAKRYIIWCVKEDYVIILEEWQKKVLLITAYCVIYPRKRSSLEAAYKKSLK